MDADFGEGRFVGFILPENGGFVNGICDSDAGCSAHCWDSNEAFQCWAEGLLYIPKTLWYTEFARVNQFTGGSIMETIAGILRTLRTERGYTQTEVAAALNLTSQAVSKWENGGSQT